MARQQVLHPKKVSNSTIDMTSLKAGIYIVRVYIDGKVKDLKVIRINTF